MKKNLFIYIFFISFIYGQDYLWPVKAEKALTAVFCEERPGRYHTGIDIRTFGEIGYPLQAIDDGYISRIQTSSKKYGKTIYLKLKDGNTAVYAHLDHFTPEIDNLVSALHEYYDKYSIDHYLQDSEYIFKKGDLIGYSGDTGGVSGPHLHFEIRDKNQQPINPFLTGLSIEDDLPPIINSIALIPLNRNSYVKGASEQIVFPIQKNDTNKYTLIDTINIQGSIGIGINTHDRITNQEFNFGIYAIELYQDEQLIYSMQYDNVKWTDSNKLYTEKNYSLARKGYGKFYHLFTHQGNEILSFINNNSKNQLIIKKNKFSNIRIKVLDYAKNESTLNFVLFEGIMPKTNNFSIHCNNDCLIKFNSNNKIRPLFHLNSRYDKNIRKKIPYDIIENNKFKINEINYPLDIIEISTINKNGIISKPKFFINDNDNEINGKINLIHYDHGIFINFEELIPSSKEAYITFNIKNELYKHELNKITPFKYSSKIFSPNELNNVSEISIHVKTSYSEEIFKTNFESNIVFPDSKFNFNFLKDKIILRGQENTFHDTTLIWVESIKTPLPKSGFLISNAYEIQPSLIPFEKEIELEIAIEKKSSPKFSSIYYFKEKNNTWNYMPSTFNQDSTHLKTTILSGEIFAIIKENNPPKLNNLIPEIGSTYFASDIKHISFLITDNLSGIDAEKDIYMELNDKRVIFEYNSYQKKVRFPLKERLQIGTHKLYIRAKDRVGNITIKKGTFNIK